MLIPDIALVEEPKLCPFEPNKNHFFGCYLYISTKLIIHIDFQKLSWANHHCLLHCPMFLREGMKHKIIRVVVILLLLPFLATMITYPWALKCGSFSSHISKKETILCCCSCISSKEAMHCIVIQAIYQFQKIYIPSNFVLIELSYGNQEKQIQNLKCCHCYSSCCS